MNIDFFKKIKELISDPQERKNIFASESLAIKTTLLGGVLIFSIFLVFIVLILEFLTPEINVEVKISGPETAEAGELITYTVSCKNTGNVIIESPELIFNHPDLSIPEKGEAIESITSDKFGNFLYPKEEKKITFKTRIFGSKDEKGNVRSWLNYKTKHSSATQVSEISTFSTQLSEIPIDLELDVPSKIPIFPETKNEFKFKIRYCSFIDYSLDNLKLEINSPPDFNLKESHPKAIEENQWNIPILEKNESGEIEVRGEFLKQQEIGKEMTFVVQLLTVIRGEKILLKETVKKSLTYRPVFLISQEINNQSEYIASPGEMLHYEVSFRNIDEKPFRDLVLISTLEEDSHDLSTIECPKGENKAGDNSITWNGEVIPELRYFQPGEEAKVEFWIRLKPDYMPKETSEINLVIRNNVSLGEFEKEFTNKVNSRLEIQQEGYYKDKYGFFENTGFPPQVNKTTTYTIVWKIKNYYSLVKDVAIKAFLPVQTNVKSSHCSQGKINIKGEFSERESPYSAIPADFSFENNLSYKTQSYEVKYLQIILKREVPYVYYDYVPPTGYFGRITLNSVMEFQKKYEKEILLPQNFKEPTGYVDKFTRLKLNELLTQGMPATSKEIVWELEKIEPGSGILSDPLTAAFQIGFTPTLIQKGKVAQLISEVSASGKDQWTGEIIFAEDELIDTSLPDDPSAKEGKIQ
ncbi:peptidoglycan-binding protein [Candidatus Parcubacteria bacterium]|nr:peptidoglycan-binding protein [Candidatus Parcubacteria bacterium]